MSFQELYKEFSTGEKIGVTATLCLRDGTRQPQIMPGIRYQASAGAIISKLIELKTRQRQLRQWWWPLNWDNSYKRCQVRIAIEQLEGILDGLGVIDWGEIE
jgi:hypothetical protein